MQNKLEKLQPYPQLRVNSFNILLVGVIGSGKSSFCNSMLSAIKNEIVHSEPFGNEDVSVTNTLNACDILAGQKDRPNFRVRFLDTRGFEQNRELGDELDLLIDGKLTEGYQFTDDTSTLQAKNTEQKTELNDQIHLICFIMDATKTAVLVEDEPLRDKFTHAKTSIYKKGIQKVCMLVKIDELCRNVEDSVEYLYKSPKVRDATDEAAKFIGIHKRLIFPIRNYTNETKTDPKIDMHLFHALDSMIFIIDTSMKTKIGVKLQTDDWINRGGALGQKADFLKLEILGKVQDPSFAEKKCPVLLVGSTQSGKSSFINSVLISLTGEISHKSIVGRSSTSKTEKKFPLKYKDTGGAVVTVPLTIYDMPGLEKNGGVTVKSIKYILGGHVPNNFKIRGNIAETSKYFKKTPLPEDKIHCVCFVVDITSGNPEELGANLKEIQTMLQNRNIPYLFLLTNIDKEDKTVDNDTSQAYYCKTIQQKATRLTREMDEPLSKMFPIKNYSQELANKKDMDALILESVKQILMCCEDYMDRMDDGDELEDSFSDENEDI